MATKNKEKTRARQIQKDTGWSYSECLRLARENISEEGLKTLKQIRNQEK